jgi:O-antigen/teichoic acid export membrane protein
VIAALKNPVFKRFAALAGGTAVGQAIMFAVLPIATQLYTPEEFGILASFSSLVLLLLPAACLRFDVAIPISRDEREALGVVTLAFMSATLIAISYATLLFATTELWGEEIQSVIETYYWLIALALWAAAMFSLVQYWAIRMKNFRELAISHAVRGFAGASTQISLGLLGISALGLLLGQSIYMGLGAIFLAYKVVSVHLEAFRYLTRNDIVAALQRNWRFPAFSAPEALLNSVSANLPLLMIVALVGIEAGGLLYVAQRLTSIPVGLISGNLSRVYLGEAQERERQKTLFAFTAKLLMLLFLTALPVAIAIFLFAQPLSTLLFGTEWARAALYLSWLVPAALLQFAVVPVATVLYVRSKQLVALLLQMSGCVLQVGSIWFCHITGIIDPVLGFAIGSAIHYALYFIVVLLHARD